MPPAHRAWIPSVRAKRLADTLRTYRQDAALSQVDAAARAGCSNKILSHYEAKRRRVPVKVVERLLDVYGVVGPEREETLAVARDAEKRSWWSEYADVLHGAYVALEDGASEICVWAPRVIPGLLQTVDYSRRIMAVGQPIRADSDERLNEKRLDARIHRQKLLSRPDAPHLRVVLDQAVLEHPVGKDWEWREQMHRLVAESTRPNVTIQVLAKTSGEHPGLEGSFIMLRMTDPDPDVLYCEGPFGAIVVENPHSVWHCNVAFELLCDQSLTAEESVALIESAATR